VPTLGNRLAFKIFAAIFSITAGALGLTEIVILKHVSSQSEKDYASRYQELTGQVADTLNQLDKTTDLIAINGLQAFREIDRRRGMLSNEELNELKKSLKVENLYILNRSGKFVRSDWFLEVASDPKLQGYYRDKPPLSRPLFSYCEGYSELIKGGSDLERTPIIPNPPGMPYEGINKYIMIPNHDRSRILEASVSVGFIGDILTKSLNPDGNVVSIGLYTPSGETLGFVRKPGGNPGETFSFNAEVKPTVESCCECKLKQLELPGKEYFYDLKMTVSKKALQEQIAGIERIFLAIGLASLLLSVLTALWVSRWLVRKLERMGKKIGEIAESADLSLRVDESGKDEVGILAGRFNAMLKQLQASQKKLATAERDRAYAEVAQQFAHDIRSPLAAFSTLLKHSNDSSEEDRSILKIALNRTREIADGMLNKYRKPKLSDTSVAEAVKTVVAEKLMNIRDRTEVTVRFEPVPEALKLKARITPLEFERLLSNLIDNSLDAIEGTGTVEISLVRDPINLTLTVKDDGKGIPQAVLSKLGAKGETHGKEGGSGLGLYHAKTNIEAWGGSLKIESTEGEGCIVIISLPIA